jgi:hypothetical protein
MKNFTDLPSVPSDHLAPFTDQLRLAVAAYLTRFKGASRYHTEYDLRCYLAWTCAVRKLDRVVDLPVCLRGDGWLTRCCSRSPVC